MIYNERRCPFSPIIVIYISGHALAYDMFPYMCSNIHCQVIGFDCFIPMLLILNFSYNKLLN